jgi:hypothetical protein
LIPSGIKPGGLLGIMMISSGALLKFVLRFNWRLIAWMIRRKRKKDEEAKRKNSSRILRITVDTEEKIDD